MKLKKEFADFYREIRIDKETNALREKREILEEDIKSKLPDILKDQNISVNRSDIRMIDQGSYKYNTTISDDVVDRDVAVMIPLDISVSSDPRKIKGYLRDTINIPSRTVSIKEPCVRASYYENGKEWLHIDLPLYAQFENSVYLARGKEYSSDYSWESADPDGLNDYLCGQINGNAQLRRVICFIKKWSIPVTRKTRQLKKEEPHDKIEMHLGGCNNPIKPEVHHGLYTEYQDCTSYRENFSCGCGYR